MSKILLGRIRDAHGIKGEVKLVSFTADPEAIAGYGALETSDGRVIAIIRMKHAKDHFIAVLKGVTDRNQAEELRGAELYIDRAQLPAAEDDEVYAHDLIGAGVFLTDGSLLGEVAGVPNYGAGDLLEVICAGRKHSVLIPYADSYVVEEAAGRIVVELPNGYLAEE